MRVSVYSYQKMCFLLNMLMTDEFYYYIRSHTTCGRTLRAGILLINDKAARLKKWIKKGNGILENIF